MALNITAITNRADFDAATSLATTPTSNQPDGAPTVFLITHSPGPSTKAFLPQYEELVQDEKWKHVLFYRMEESPETAPLIKFGPQARPIVMLVSCVRFWRIIDLGAGVT